MDATYRVWGSTLGDGAWTAASSAQEAIEIVAGVFHLPEADLTAALDKDVAEMIRGIILDQDGKTIVIIRR